MRLSVVQRVEILLLRQLINGLWLIDLTTGYPLQSALRFSARPLVLLCIAIIVSLSLLLPTAGVVSHSLKENKPIENLFNNSQLTIERGVLGKSSEIIKKPILLSGATFPEVTAKSVLVVDKNSGEYLYEREKNKKLASASTTKLMTALIALNIYSGDEVLTVSQECAEVESTRAELPAGYGFKAQDLIGAMLVSSAGDAACVLGSAKIDPNEFLYLMNESALELGMKNTFFTNTIGLDGVNGAQFSTAEDLYALARAAMEKPDIRKVVSTYEFELVSENSGYSAKLKNTNRLLEEIPGSVGVKTGTTQEAGEVLIYEYDDDKKDIVIIVMGSKDRFYDTKTILHWVLENYTWE